MTRIFNKKYWHAMTVDEAVQALESNRDGLTAEEARQRLADLGPNELKTEKRTSPVKILASQLKSLLIVILIVAIAISLFLGEVIDATVIVVIVVITAVLGFVQEYRSEKALEALKGMLSPKASVLRDGKETEIDAKKIVLGDIILLREGDKVPADARLMDTARLQLNEASLTGESMPVNKTTSIVPDRSAMADRSNMVFSGTVVTYGRGKAVVVSTGMNTEFGKIAGQVSIVTVEKTPLERRMEELGKWLGYLCLAVVATVVGISVLKKLLFDGAVGMDFGFEMLLFGAALAVAAVPEALPAIVTGSLAIGMRKMAKRNALVRKMSAVETLGCTTVICSDKTGTLTKGEMTVRSIYFSGGFVDVKGVGYEPKGELTGSTPEANESKAFSNLMKACVLCNDANVVLESGRWHIRGDPTEGALIVVASKAGFRRENLRKEYPRVYELPFSSERKRMTTVHSTRDGKKLVFVKGAPEVIVERCIGFYVLDDVHPMSEDMRKGIVQANVRMADEALRVIAFACKELHEESSLNEDILENHLVFLGLAGMIDPPREEAIEAVEACKRVKIKPIMITGDHKLTAVAVAKQLRIYSEGDMSLTGQDLENLSEQELAEIIERVTVYARVSPEHKLKIVRAWKSKGHVVAMTGDGVNDAPALKHADIGIAMGITGTEVSKEAASMVLTDDNFATIVKAVEMGRWIYDNIKKYLTYLLQANIVEIIVLSSLVLVGFPLPLLPAAILYINLATDGLPAIALGVGPPDPDVMNRPPRSPSETIFTKDVKFFLLRAVLIEIPLLLLAYLWMLPNGLEFTRGGVFLAFIFIELALALNSRSLKYTVLEAKPHRFLIISVIWEIVLVLILVNVTAVREAFGIAFPGPIQFGLAIVLSLVTFFSVETLKHTLRGHLKLQAHKSSL